MNVEDNDNLPRIIYTFLSPEKENKFLQKCISTFKEF